LLTKLLAAGALMALCVMIHASGLAWALRRLRRYAGGSRAFWQDTLRFITLAAWLILLHLAEISVWAAFFYWKGAIPDAPSAFYFSGVTYTTTGYGDIVLPQDWRLAGGVEALTGILMCGWSTGFFMAEVLRLYESRVDVAKR
jgi:voltage-gated potassium channel Kch